jgi:hypothetical protein
MRSPATTTTSALEDDDLIVRIRPLTKALAV